MENILQTFNLTKVYGNKTVVNNVKMNIQKGDIYGFIGKNGAGKTTFMRLILGMAFETSGSYKLFDEENPVVARRRIGTLIEKPAIFENCTALENMKRFNILFGGNSCDIEDLLKIVGLSEVENKKVKSFSLGMKQRLGIAIAMIGNPEFLILDEPINGLDPAGIKEVRDLILKIHKERNVTFLISSHLLDELSKIATKYGIINNGVLMEEITAKELENLCRKKLIIEVDDVLRAFYLIKEIVPEENIKIHENILTLSSNINESGQINRLLVQNNILVSRIERHSETLEKYFMEKVGM